MTNSELLPNLILPGVAKSGTSSLHRYLNQHPDIFMSPVKEPGYFFFEELYLKKFNWYKKLFEGGEVSRYRGESSTYYFKHLPSLQRIQRDLINPKFIILIRHPIERVISHYNWIRGKGLEFRNFRSAVLFDFNEEFRPSYNIKGRYKCYIQNSFYSQWLRQYFELFGRENVLVITSERLSTNSLETVNKCFDFLGLSHLSELDDRNYNKTRFQQMPLWDRFILNFLFLNNDRAAFTKIRDLIIPDTLKEFYWRNHNRVNGVKLLKRSPEIAEEDYKWLFEVLKDDVKQLKELLSYNFDEWEDLRGV